MPLTREELTTLRDAIDMTLALPDSIRELLAQSLAPQTSKPNGRDPISLCSRRRRARSGPAAPLNRPRRKRPSDDSRRDGGQSRAQCGRACQRRGLEPIGDRRAIEADGAREAWSRRISPADGI